MSTRASRQRQRRGSQNNSSSGLNGKPTNSAGAANGAELVGRLIDVEWPSPENSTYFVGLVVSYNSRRHLHKIIYLEDESIETLELGNGPKYRNWRETEQPSDPLIGSRVRIEDSESNAQESWFDFMRVNPKRRSTNFEVYVYARIEDPDPEEVSGPHDSSKQQNQYYRVIHAPNDYLTTIDMSSIEYTVEEQLKAILPPSEEKHAGDDSNFNNDTNEEVDAKDSDVDYEPHGNSAENIVSDEDEESPSHVPSKPVKPVDANIVEGDIPETSEEDHQSREKPISRKLETGSGVEEAMGASISEVPAGTTVRTAKARANDILDLDYFENDDEIIEDKVFNEKVLSRRRRGSPIETIAPSGRKIRRQNSRSEVVADDIDRLVGGDDVEMGNGGTKLTVEGSPATQDTRDEPVLSSRRGRGARASTLDQYDDSFDQDKENDNAHDTASDDDQMGWPEKPQSEGRMVPSLVGDYVSLDTGSGGPWRKAYVEAYLPVTGTHFVAFCDSQGGNMQIKLTSDNHTVLGDKEAAKLTRDQARSKVETVPVADNDFEPNEVEISKVGSPEPSRRLPRKGRRKGSIAAKKETKPKPKLQLAKPYMKILGKTAKGEILSRCITVVWPNTKLVYVALVIGYSVETKHHMLLYMVDHCVEVLELKYRDWQLLPRGKEPWNSSGMVGKRIYVWWPGEYETDEAQTQAEELFGEGKTKVAYEAYVLNYIGQGIYKIVYPCNEDCEERALLEDKTDGLNTLEKEWDLLDEGVNEVMGLPVIGWEG